MTTEIECLDRDQPFGTIQPPWTPLNCDRPAYYEAGGKLYDMKGYLIVPGEPLDVAAVAVEEERAKAAAVERALEAADVEVDRQAQERSAAAAQEREKRAALRQRVNATPSVITPAYEAPGCDRPAHYELGGKYLDEQGREIVPGQPLTPEKRAELQAEVEAVEGLLIADLIAKASIIPFHAFVAASRSILGKTCPRGCDSMLAQLRLVTRTQPGLRVPRIRPAS